MTSQLYPPSSEKLLPQVNVLQEQLSEEVYVGAKFNSYIVESVLCGEGSSMHVRASKQITFC